MSCSIIQLFQSPAVLLVVLRFILLLLLLFALFSPVWFSFFVYQRSSHSSSLPTAHTLTAESERDTFPSCMCKVQLKSIGKSYDMHTHRHSHTVPHLVHYGKIGACRFQQKWEAAKKSRHPKKAENKFSIHWIWFEFLLTLRQAFVVVRNVSSRCRNKP